MILSDNVHPIFLNFIGTKAKKGKICRKNNGIAKPLSFHRSLETFGEFEENYSKTGKRRPSFSPHIEYPRKFPVKCFCFLISHKPPSNRKSNIPQRSWRSANCKSTLVKQLENLPFHRELDTLYSEFRRKRVARPSYGDYCQEQQTFDKMGQKFPAVFFFSLRSVSRVKLEIFCQTGSREGYRSFR